MTELKSKPTHPKHILIVEDSVEQQILIKALLEARGYTAECTSNGEEALQLLRISKKNPETILIDLNMPVMNGVEFCERQMADPTLNDIHTVMMTGDDEALDLGLCNDILMKPLTVRKLLDAVDRTVVVH